MERKIRQLLDRRIEILLDRRIRSVVGERPGRYALAHLCAKRTHFNDIVNFGLDIVQ